MYGEIRDLFIRKTLERYPCLTAHIIAESLGYATPSLAGRILMDAREGRENYCEWIYSCYDRNPLRAVRDAIKRRHSHKGFMADYGRAKVLVKQAIEEGIEPLFGSWF